jgi:hypothetical protein
MTWGCSDPSWPPLPKGPQSTGHSHSIPPLQPPALLEGVALTLDRSSMVARECRLTVFLSSGPAIARLGCQYGNELVEPSPLLIAEEPLVPVEWTRLLALARAADLFGGGHFGVGGGGNDAPFETLHVTGERNVSAILVASGNPTFESEGPRRHLLEALLAIWDRLRAQGRTGPG